MVTVSRYMAVLLLVAATASPAAFAQRAAGDEAAEQRRKDMAAVAAANNEFAADFFGRIRGQRHGNIFFSPYSISTALSMTMAGARGETEKQMASTLKMKLEPERAHAASGLVIRNLNEAGQKGKFALHVANALWGQAGYGIKREFIETVEKNYSGAMRELDFQRNPEPSRITINQWVEKQTNEKIRNLLPEGSITPLTKLVLTNAIYFKGKWQESFDPKLTRDAPFATNENAVSIVPMMHQKSHFPYGETDDAQVIRLPYDSDNRLSMIIVLPKKTAGLGDIEAALNIEKLNAYLVAPGRSREVMVFIPRFKVEWQATLNGTLKEMGMTDAFDPNKADFTGMKDGDDLHITAVVHKAYVDVNEEGTEAAAATGIVVGITSVGPEPVVFRADHPFLFFIHDSETGAILFMGRLANPSLKF